jgi:hypothetical protein
MSNRLPSKLIIFFIILLFLLLSPTTIFADGPTINVKEYVAPDNSTMETQVSSGEYFSTHKGTQEGEYILCKNKNCSSFEKRFVLSDGSIGLQGENYWQGDNTTFQYLKPDGSLVSWLPATMTVGQVWNTGDMTVQGYQIINNDDGTTTYREYNPQYSGPTGGVQIKLDSVGPKTFKDPATGKELTLPDVAVFEIVEGPGKGEFFYYANGGGQVGWNNYLPVAVSNLPPKQMKAIVESQLQIIEIATAGAQLQKIPNTCVAGNTKPPDGELRPNPCDQCKTTVPKPADACIDTAVIETEGKYKVNQLDNCEGSWYGVWDWDTQFTINTQETKVPFVSYREILPNFASQQKYLADYFEGTAFYDGQVPDPTDPDYLTKAGLWRVFAEPEIQDYKKITMIKKGFDYEVKDNQGHRLTMQAWGTCPYNPDDPLAKDCHLPPEKSHPRYQDILAEWFQTPYGKLWPYVPMFSREDTSGKIIAEIENPPGELSITTPEAKQITTTKVEFPLSFPHLKRLYEVTQALQQLVIPKVEPQPTSPPTGAGLSSQLASNQLLQPNPQVLAQGNSEFVEDNCGLFVEKNGFVKYYNNNRNSCGIISDYQLTVEYDIDQTDFQVACHTDRMVGELLPYAPDGHIWPTNISDNDLGGGNNHCGKIGGKSVTSIAKSSFIVRVTTSGGRGNCQQTITREARVIKDKDGNWIAQGCGAVAAQPPVEDKCHNPNTFSPLGCLENSIKDDNDKLDSVCCSDTANVKVEDYKDKLYGAHEYCGALKSHCCNGDADCEANICDNPQAYSCPWEKATLSRQVRFDTQIPYLSKIWDQIGGMATNIEDFTTKTGILNFIRPADFPFYQTKFARSEIELSISGNTAGVDGKTPLYSDQAPAQISPVKADFYFPYLGGVELAKQWFVDSLRPKEMQEGVKSPFGNQ